MRSVRSDRLRNDPTGFWVVCRGQAEPTRAGQRAPSCAANPAMGFECFSQACQMLFRSTPVRPFVERLRTANRCGPSFLWAAIRSWVSRATDPGKCSLARSDPADCSGCVPVRTGINRESNCGGDILSRRRPFSVFGRFAPSRSERFEAVASVTEDVLPFRTRFLSEVSHRPV